VDEERIAVFRMVLFLEYLSCPDLRELFYFSIWLGQGVIRVGILCFLFLCFWTSVVPNQRQLSVVVSDWESYLGSLFPHLCFVGSCFLFSLCYLTELFRFHFVTFFECFFDHENFSRCALVHSF
jgi:preprotein translocase subunit SecY